MKFVDSPTTRTFFWRPPPLYLHTDAADRLVHWASEAHHPVALVAGAQGAGKTSLVEVFAGEAWQFDRIAFFEPEDYVPGEDVVAAVAAAIRHFGGVPLDRVLVVIDDADKVLGNEEFARLIVALQRRRLPLRWLLTTSSLPDPVPDLTRTWLVPVSRWSPDEAQRMLDVAVARLPLDSYEMYQEMHHTLSRISAPPGIVLHAIEVLSETGSIDAARAALGLGASPGLVLRESSTDPGRIEAVPAVPEEPVSLAGESSPLVSVTPLMLRPRARGLFGDALDELEDLVNTPTTREAQLQDFFERYPRILGGVDYTDVVAQPVLHRAEGGPLIPDFMLAPASSQFADILDLKLPSAPLVVGAGDRLRFSSVVGDALAQVREYRHYFDEDENRKETLARYGLHAFRPKVTVVIGRRPRRTDVRQVRRAWDDLPGSVRVVTYDQLVARVRLWDSISRW